MLPDRQNSPHYLAALRAAALIQLCGGMQPMEAGPAGQKDTGPRGWTAACSGSMRCGWAVVPHRPEAYSMYVGGHEVRQTAADRDSEDAVGRHLICPEERIVYKGASFFFKP